MTDKQIIIDEQMENLNNLATQQLKRIEEEKRQIEHIAKTHLVETFDMQREIDKLKKELQAKEQECGELEQAYLETNELLQQKTKECTNLKIENKKLKDIIETKLEDANICDSALNYINDEYIYVKQQLDQLKADNDELKRQLMQYEKDVKDLNYFAMKLKQTLTEIKEIAEKGFKHSQCNCGAKADLDLILQKISEVEE